MSPRRITFGFLAAGALICVGLFAGRTLRSSRNQAPGEETNASAAIASGPASSAESSRRIHSRNTVEDRWQRRWQELSALTDESQRNREREAFLEELAATDPLRAIELAKSETDPDLVTSLTQAALRGWGGANPDGAAAWAFSQSAMDTGQALASVFHGAARDPESALRLNAKLSEQYPEQARDFGSYLVEALTRTGDFSDAAGFAANGDEGVRVDWLNSAYSHWADDQPEAALEHLAKLSDPEIKRTAFDAAISRWADKDPQAVADHALALPAGREQTFALSVALRSWAGSDASEAATWISRFEPSSQFDFGAAIIASQPDALLQPDVATSWAESVVDPGLRVRVIASVVKEWAAIDPVAARQYAETSPNVSPEDRPGVLAAFDPGFNPISLLP